MKRTTIVTDETLLLEAQHLAKKQKKSTSQLIREALEEYLEKHKPKRERLKFIGAGKSGRKDISLKTEEILEEAFRK